MATARVPAFKEWAVIVHALLEGEQVIDVRKGGIHEDGRHFALHATRVWLYPTFLHQQHDLLKPAYRPVLERLVAAAPPDDVVAVPAWADIVGVAKITEPDHLAALDSKFVWTLDYAASRLKWKRRDPLWVLAMRVHLLDQPLEVPFREEYRGCTSWVDLDGLPGDPTEVRSVPALSDEAFEARLSGVRDALPGDLEAPVVAERTS